MKRLTNLSQKFLKSPRLVSELIGHTNIKKTDVVYDIGAGTGIITSCLASRCKQVVAIEVDPRAIPILIKNTEHFDNVQVAQEDFLDSKLPMGDYKVFANIPFNQSAPIVAKLATAKNPPLATYLIVQKQFARKLLPDWEGYTGQAAVLYGVEFEIKIRYYLKPTDFEPQAKVPTVLMAMLKRPEPLVKGFELVNFREFVTDVFALNTTIDKSALKFMPPRRYQDFAKNENIAVGTKPSQLKLTQWVTLYRLSRQ
jgi:16S rRNA A1518/A1519 N6-dimethyltransferase RsmA/KsgA/DIM1 with predicted DNA glycosylase/AP lyase activity